MSENELLAWPWAAGLNTAAGPIEVLALRSTRQSVDLDGTPMSIVMSESCFGADGFGRKVCETRSANTPYPTQTSTRWSAFPLAVNLLPESGTTLATQGVPSILST